jgi:NAD(P)-dependent dehydrogenase (short-subunit alcohol dehydrogenase family)
MGLLENKVVAVTGGGRGIGREIALCCAAEGAAVVVNDLGTSGEGGGADKGPANEVAEEIVSAGGRAVANQANVADEAGAASIVADAINAFGRIDGVVNNAAIMRDRIFHKMSADDWKTIIDVDLTGAFLVSKAAAPYFKEQNSGHFVHLTSASGLIGNFGQANYSAAKLGIVGLSNSIALDMQRYGVTSNAICPFAWSRLTGTIPTATDEERIRVERMKSMTPAKIAPMATFLCSELANGISGQIFGVRKNEVFLFNMPRPVRGIHRSEGWTPRSIADELIPAFRPSMQPLQRSSDVFCWDPV